MTRCSPGRPICRSPGRVLDCELDVSEGPDRVGGGSLGRRLLRQEKHQGRGPPEAFPARRQPSTEPTLARPRHSARRYGRFSTAAIECTCELCSGRRGLSPVSEAGRANMGGMFDAHECYRTGMRPRCRARSNQFSMCSEFVAIRIWGEVQPSRRPSLTPARNGASPSDTELAGTVGT